MTSRKECGSKPLFLALSLSTCLHIVLFMTVSDWHLPSATKKAKSALTISLSPRKSISRPLDNQQAIPQQALSQSPKPTTKAQEEKTSFIADRNHGVKNQEKVIQRKTNVSAQIEQKRHKSANSISSELKKPKLILDHRALILDYSHQEQEQLKNDYLEETTACAKISTVEQMQSCSKQFNNQALTDYLDDYGLRNDVIPDFIKTYHKNQGKIRQSCRQSSGLIDLRCVIFLVKKILD